MCRGEAGLSVTPMYGYFCNSFPLVPVVGLFSPLFFLLCLSQVSLHTCRSRTLICWGLRRLQKPYLPEDDVLAAEKGDGLMSAKAGDVFMGWSKSTHPATTEEGEADVGSTSGQSSSYSPTYRPPTSPVSPPPSPELARVLDMAEVIRTYYDDITASFELMESDDAVEERTSLVEPEEWASDGDDSVFDHEVDPLHTVEKRYT